jgi:hypothetical protein
MTERPDDLSFAAPGPGGGTSDADAAPVGVSGPPAPGPAGPGPAAPAGGWPGATASAPAPVPYGERWGAPGGPTAAERAQARRRARIWVIGTLALIVLVVGLAAGISALVSRSHERAWEPVPTDVAAPTQANAVQLVLGSCLSSVPASDVPTEVEVVPCADPHAAQVVGRTDSAPDAVWPGDDVVARRAAQSCSAALFGPDAREAGAEASFVVWAPTEASWEDGDRAGLCLAVSAAPTSGSLLK